jgi:hypothetical protein
MYELAYFSRVKVALASAERAMAFLESSRRPDGSWPTAAGGSDGDVATTAAAFFALRTAEVLTGVESASTLAARDWLVARLPALKTAPYVPRAIGRLSPSDPDALMAWIGLVRVFSGDHPETHPDLLEHFEWLASRPPAADDASLEFVVHGSYFAYQIGGVPWVNWNKAMKALYAGSRDAPAQPILGAAPGGRAHELALRALALEVYFRYGKLLAG